MKPIRRVVTGQSPDGRAIIVSDGLVDPIEIALAPGNVLFQFWGSDQAPKLPSDGSKPVYHDWFPPAGGFRFAYVAFPPEAPPPDMSAMSLDQVQAFMTAGLAEADAKLPGLLAVMEPDNPGFHRSDTVDLLYLISGELVLDLDDGHTTTLKPGDTVVQNGIRHAWRNLSTEMAHVLVVSIGAPRAG